MNIERQLATIRRISDILPIEGADKIEVAVIDGWKVVVKKGDFKVGHLAVYLEIDSWVPHTLAPFLTKNGHYPKVYNGVEGQRLKTVKLRGQLSQGLLLPLSVFDDLKHGYLVYGQMNPEGFDVTELLGIQKWEREIPAQLAGVMKGNFPTEVFKTDQQRIQNLTKRMQELNEHTFEVTEKLHGSSATFYMDLNGEFHVCSRNVDLKDSEGNTYWEIARKYKIEENMRRILDEDAYGMAIQGEIIGPGINGNQYGLTECDFYVFDLFESKNQTYCPADLRYTISESLGLKHVPVIYGECCVNAVPVEVLLEDADGLSQIGNVESRREGLVWKSLYDPSVSFKVVSNQWLENGE